MSVAQLTADELGQFAAHAVKHGFIKDLTEAVRLAAVASEGNAAAWHANYDDAIEPVPADAIEAAALKRLADNNLGGHFGPVAYNMIANDGRAYIDGGVLVEQDNATLTLIGNLEDKIHAIMSDESRAAERAEANAVAFNEVGRLKTYPKAEILAACKAAGCDRVIIAEFNVDESDMMSDYHGGRTTRVVVIGFGKGKRENFRQLRAAAAKFPPTAHLGPGKDHYSAFLKWDHDKKDAPGRAFINTGDGWFPDQPTKGHSVLFHWYKDRYAGSEGRWGFDFDNEADAKAFVAANPPLAGTYWEIDKKSYEHRECWSMGGGNYLTAGGRYRGWQVGSSGHFPNEIEWWNPDEAKPVAAHSKPASVVRLVENNDKDGYELHFEAKPSESTMTVLKAAGFRAAKRDGKWFWYVKRSPLAKAVAERIAGNTQ